jgi:hypothetical protein
MQLNNNYSSPSNSTFVVATISGSPFPQQSLPAYTQLGTPYSYLLKNGIAVTSQAAKSGNYVVNLNYFSLPFNASGNWTMINYLVYAKVNASQYCNASTSPQNYFESAVYNLLARRYSNNMILCQSYYIASAG